MTRCHFPPPHFPRHLLLYPHPVFPLLPLLLPLALHQSVDHKHFNIQLQQLEVTTVVFCVLYVQDTAL